MVEATKEGEGKPSEGSTSVEKLTKCAIQLRTCGRRIATGLRQDKVTSIRMKIEGSSVENDRQLFRHLNKLNGIPSSAVKDPETNERIFDTERQHETMITQWKKYPICIKPARPAGAT